MENMNGDMVGKTCGCNHHKVFPSLVILFGLLFLLGAYGSVSTSFVSVAWPVLVIIAGLFMVFKNKCKCC